MEKVPFTYNIGLVKEIGLYSRINGKFVEIDSDLYIPSPEIDKRSRLGVQYRL